MDSIAWKEGDRTPSLSLPDAKGEPVRLNQLLEQGPVVAISRQTPDHALNAWWGLPLPASFVVDKGGVIQLAHLEADYRERAEAGDVLAVQGATQSALNRSDQHGAGQPKS